MKLAKQPKKNNGKTNKNQKTIEKPKKTQKKQQKTMFSTSDWFPECMVPETRRKTNHLWKTLFLF